MLHVFVSFLSVSWVGPTGWGGGTLKFLYIRRLGLFFGVQSFEFQYFFVFRKTNIFLRYEDFVDIFWGSPQNLPIFRGHFYAF